MKTVHASHDVTRKRPSEFAAPHLRFLPDPGSEDAQIEKLLASPPLNAQQRLRTSELAKLLAQDARMSGANGVVDRLMAAYSLSSSKGCALMELAEALLRVPDSGTADVLIKDKVGSHDWLSAQPKGLAHIAGVALTAAGMMLDPRRETHILAAANRLGMPTIRACMASAMRLMGNHFVLAQTIRQAVSKVGDDRPNLYSFDMLGEAARTEADADAYFSAYSEAIAAGDTRPITNTRTTTTAYR